MRILAEATQWKLRLLRDGAIGGTLEAILYIRIFLVTRIKPQHL